MKFHEWICVARVSTEQRDRLREMVLRYDGFPSSRIGAIGRLKDLGADAEILADFNKAWRSYLAYLRQKEDWAL